MQIGTCELAVIILFVRSRNSRLRDLTEFAEPVSGRAGTGTRHLHSWLKTLSITAHYFQI